MRLRSACLALLLAAAGDRALASPDGLTDRLAAAVAGAGLGDATVAVAVRRVADGGLVFGRHATDAVIPASNAKVFTAAAAWLRLGPEWRWTTTVAAQGGLGPDGTLAGDLLVRGDGDPTISARFGGGRATATFEQWATILRARGLRRVAGDLLLDDSAFDAQRLHPDWPENQIARWYSAEIAALTLNDGCVDVLVTAAGARPRIVADPATAYVEWDNDARATASRREHQVSFWRAAGGNRIRIWGQVWTGAADAPFSVPVQDPALFFGQVLRESLARGGITVEGTVRRATADEARRDGPAWVRHRAPLGLAVGVCLARSQNLYAEHLCKTLGRETRGEGSWAAGCAAIAEALRVAGVPAGAVALRDGSGYSRESRVTADALARVLVHLGRRPDFEAWRACLAAPGEPGTLDDRLTESPVRDRVRAKTGYLAGVSALSGYAQGADGAWYAFAVLVNGLKGPAAPAKRLQDRIARLLVESGA